MTSEYLFPTRRNFLAGAASLALGGLLTPAQEKPPVKFGAGKTTFELDESWGKLPDGMRYGLGCALVVDSKDRIFVTSRSTSPCVAIFDKTGKLEATWSKEFTQAVGFEKPEQVQATAHGLYLSKEGDKEFLYWTENVANGAKPGEKIGKRVYKTDLNGKVLYTLGNVEKDTDTTQKVDWTNPTDVAVAPNGDIYIVDGYGSQKVYRFDKNFKLLKVIGGNGTEHGQFRTCHGVWVSTLRKDPEIYIADRANNRLEVFSPELEYKRTIPDMRNPCCFYQHDGLLYIPELGARVSIIDADDKIVARLGDGAGDPKAEEKPEKFKTPHALTVSSTGDLYVIEWVPFGRPRKFKKV